jgi:hypothetical protein
VQGPGWAGSTEGTFFSAEKAIRGKRGNSATATTCGWIRILYLCNQSLEKKRAVTWGFRSLVAHVLGSIATAPHQTIEYALRGDIWKQQLNLFTHLTRSRITDECRRQCFASRSDQFTFTSEQRGPKAIEFFSLSLLPRCGFERENALRAVSAVSLRPEDLPTSREHQTHHASRIRRSNGTREPLLS